MKTIILVLAMLFLVTACATTRDGESSDPKVSYGGSYRVRGTVSSGIHQ